MPEKFQVTFNNAINPVEKPYIGSSGNDHTYGFSTFYKVEFKNKKTSKFHYIYAGSEDFSSFIDALNQYRKLKENYRDVELKIIYPRKVYFSDGSMCSIAGIDGIYLSKSFEEYKEGMKLLRIID